MSKHGMNGTPPVVGVSNKQAQKKASKIVNMKGSKFEKPADDTAVLDPRLMCMGSFAIPQEQIRSRFDDIMELMRDIVVTDATLRMTPQGNMFVYTGISHKYFKPVGDGAKIPMYNIGKRLDGVFVVEPANPLTPPQIVQ